MKGVFAKQQRLSQTDEQDRLAAIATLSAEHWCAYRNWHLVNEQCHFLSAMMPLQLRYPKQIADKDSLFAVIQQCYCRAIYFSTLLVRFGVLYGAVDRQKLGVEHPTIKV